MKYIKYLLVIALTALVLPSSLYAKSEKIDISKYKTMNLKETLAAEEMEEEFTKYSEKDDQITIYLFRGQGCGYCRAFLTFLNGITEEYGKYFKLVSFEVWNDTDNNALFETVHKFVEGTKPQGVPYIIIGEKTFPGYNAVYDEEIKNAIKEEYEKDSKDRYDVFKAMNNVKTETSTTSAAQIAIITLINLVVVAVATLVVIASQNKKFAELESLINKNAKKSKE